MKGHLQLIVCVLTAVMLSATTAVSGSDSTFKGSFERILKVSGVVDIDLTTGSGNIQVRPGEAATVQIRGKIQAHSEDQVQYLASHPPIEQDGNRIRIGPVEDPAMNRNVSIDYELLVPVETQLTIQSGSGDVSVEGTHGSVKARSGSGDMKFQQIASDRVEAETGSGDVQFREVRGSLRVRTGSGNIEAEGEPTGEWTLQTGSGGVSLHLPSQVGFDLDARTGSGEVATGLSIEAQGTLRRGELRGKVRGGGARLEVRAGSGDIHIE